MEEKTSAGKNRADKYSADKNSASKYSAGPKRRSELMTENGGWGEEPRRS